MGVTVLCPGEHGGEGVCMEAILTLEGSVMWAQQTQGGTQASYVYCFIISSQNMATSNTSHELLSVILTA